MTWGTEVEKEIRNRIRLSVAAYAYEVHDDPIMSDHDFDQLALLIDTSVKTGNRKMDNFFKKHFATDTGMWIHNHPQKNGLQKVYNMLKLKAKK